MPDESTANATQVDTDATSQVDTTSEQSGESQSADTQDTVSSDDLKKVRSEARNLRTRLKEAESRLAEFENAGKSDDERRTAELTALQERAERAEAALRTSNGKTAVFNALTSMNPAVSPETIYRFVRDDIEFDDDGQPTNVEQILKTAQKSDPHLFKTATADGAARGGATNTNDMNALIRGSRGR